MHQNNFFGEKYFYYNARTKLLSLSCLKIATESGNRCFDIGRYIFQGSRVFDGRYGRFNLVVVNFWAYAGRIIMFQVCLMTIFGLHLHIQNKIVLSLIYMDSYQWYRSLVNNVNNWLISKETGQCVTLDYFSVVSHVYSEWWGQGCAICLVHDAPSLGRLIWRNRRLILREKDFSGIGNPS